MYFVMLQNARGNTYAGGSHDQADSVGTHTLIMLADLLGLASQSFESRRL